VNRIECRLDAAHRLVSVSGVNPRPIELSHLSTRLAYGREESWNGAWNTTWKSFIKPIIFVEEDYVDLGIDAYFCFLRQRRYREPIFLNAMR